MKKIILCDRCLIMNDCKVDTYGQESMPIFKMQVSSEYCMRLVKNLAFFLSLDFKLNPFSFSCWGTST